MVECTATVSAVDLRSCHVELTNVRWVTSPQRRDDAREVSVMSEFDETVMISKVGLTGDFEVVITLTGERVIRALLPPLLSAAMDVARNHWPEVLDLHYERQGRVDAAPDPAPGLDAAAPTTNGE